MRRTASRPRQFQAQLAAKRLRTVRQQVRAEPEVKLGIRHETVPRRTAQLPDFPKPPYEPAMRIDVPEKQLVAQWRLGDWHLKRWSQRVRDDTYCVSIWDPAPPNSLGYTAIGLESSTNIRALDMLGSADVAHGGLNWWLFFVKRSMPWGKFVDLGDGPLTAPGHNLEGMKSHYDEHHAGGHGRVLESCATALPPDRRHRVARQGRPGAQEGVRLDHSTTQEMEPEHPAERWCYGLQPPTDLCDGSDVRLFFCLNAWYYAGLKRAAEVLAARSGGKYAELVKEAELFRQDIRKATDRSLALSPVVKVADGTYRRCLPFAPYMRGLGTRDGYGFRRLCKWPLV